MVENPPSINPNMDQQSKQNPREKKNPENQVENPFDDMIGRAIEYFDEKGAKERNITEALRNMITSIEVALESDDLSSEKVAEIERFFEAVSQKDGMENLPMEINLKLSHLVRKFAHSYSENSTTSEVEDGESESQVVESRENIEREAIIESGKEVIKAYRDLAAHLGSEPGGPYKVGWLGAAEETIKSEKEWSGKLDGIKSRFGEALNKYRVAREALDNMREVQGGGINESHQEKLIRGVIAELEEDNKLEKVSKLLEEHVKSLYNPADACLWPKLRTKLGLNKKDLEQAWNKVDGEVKNMDKNLEKVEQLSKWALKEITTKIRNKVGGMNLYEEGGNPTEQVEGIYSLLDNLGGIKTVEDLNLLLGRLELTHIDVEEDIAAKVEEIYVTRHEEGEGEENLSEIDEGKKKKEKADIWFDVTKEVFEDKVGKIISKVNERLSELTIKNADREAAKIEAVRQAGSGDGAGVETGVGNENSNERAVGVVYKEKIAELQEVRGKATLEYLQGVFAGCEERGKNSLVRGNTEGNFENTSEGLGDQENDIEGDFEIVEQEINELLISLVGFLENTSDQDLEVEEVVRNFGKILNQLKAKFLDLDGELRQNFMQKITDYQADYAGTKKEELLKNFAVVMENIDDNEGFKSSVSNNDIKNKINQISELIDDDFESDEFSSGERKLNSLFDRIKKDYEGGEIDKNDLELAVTEITGLISYAYPNMVDKFVELMKLPDDDIDISIFEEIFAEVFESQKEKKEE